MRRGRACETGANRIERGPPVLPVDDPAYGVTDQRTVWASADQRYAIAVFCPRIKTKWFLAAFRARSNRDRRVGERRGFASIS